MNSHYRQLEQRGSWLILIFSGLGVLFYLWISGFSGGFPLDDGWIHQTYARNFAQTGRWEYVPGEVSAGSTAPLWTLWLAVGYFLKIPYAWWTFGSGWLTLAWTGIAGMWVWQRLWRKKTHCAWVAGILIITSWQLIWAAGSGMETLSFSGLGLTIIAYYLDVIDGEKPNWKQVGLVGLLCGLLILIRPDGLGLTLLILAGLLWKIGSLAGAVQAALIFSGAFLTPLLPYFALNYVGGGTILPNTFYAKQAEYAILLQTFLPWRFIRLLYFSLGGPENGWQGLSGAHWLLLIGWIVAGINALKSDLNRRQLRTTLPLLWGGGHIFLYAWRLPVTYQHGRYLLAALPIWILFGLAGWLQLCKMPAFSGGSLGRIVKKAGVLILTIIWLFFFIVGGRQYGADVAFIDNEMVQMSHWLRENTSEGALIASHDIGAIGYFAQRPLLDLAGLISPEIIPYLTDESQMAVYLLESNADYLVTAPGWRYSDAVQKGGLHPLFNTDYPETVAQGLNNMEVYSLNSR